jgi:hypothetical protein
MTLGFDAVLRAAWREHVERRYLYRGMSARDLADPLDPAHDPFAAVRARLYWLLDLLEGLLAHGFEFTVHEDYSGLSFDLKDIVAWTRCDLSDPGIDFASDHGSARGYAQNHEGSQLRQNLRYITAHLPDRRDDPLVRSMVRERHWAEIAELHEWAAGSSPEHRPVVVQVRRSCEAFEPEGPQPLLVGSCRRFRRSALALLEREGLPATAEGLADLLARQPESFYVRLKRRLPLSEVQCVEELPA